MSRARDFADLAGAADAGTVSGANLFINGDMAVAQRGDVTISASSSGYGGADRWITYITAGTATMDVSQDTDVPSGQGFSNSQKMACSTTGTFSSSSYSLIGQLIEGQNLQHLKFGTSSAESLTLSFWVKSNKTGTFNVEIRSTDSTLPTATTYQNVTQVTISAADTWEYKTFTIAGNTSGDIRNNSFAGLEIYMWLKTGSDFTSSGDVTGNGWVTYLAGNTGYGADIDITTSTSDYFAITGVKLEVGSTATPFLHESYGENLAKCQRYYWQNANNSGYYAYQYVSTHKFLPVFFPVPMRATPTADVSYSTGSFTEYATSEYGFKSYITSSYTDTTGYSTTYVKFEAEL